MEHVVLGGSKRYPLKDPFFEKSKSSLATYLNAFTGTDYTTYPVACENHKDFLNLVDLYIDSLFAPLLSEVVFKREGHMLKVAPSGELVYSGIVFNEMKGMYANVNYLFHKLARKALFPNTAYAKNSGGDPEHIPSLTYKKFLEFYSERYHPSLCKVIIYGDTEPNEIFERLEGYFKNYEPKAPLKYTCTDQDPKEINHTFEEFYPATEQGENDARDRHAAICWALPPTQSAYESIRMSFIFNLLAGTVASPLRKALSESGLGATPIGDLDDDSIPVPVFVAGIHQISPSDIAKMNQIILETIRQVVKEGFPSDLIDAELANFEFSLRELANSADRGINIVTSVATEFLRGSDPIEELSFEKLLRQLKEELARGQEDILQSLDGWLLRNTWRSEVVLSPDLDFQKKRDALEISKLAALKQSMSASELAKVSADAEVVEAAVAADDSPESLAAMPSLTIDDLDRKEKDYEFKRLTGAGGFLHVPERAHGICYTSVALDVGHLRVEELPFLGLFVDLLFAVGTSEHTYDKFSTVIGTETGGIYVRPMAVENMKNDQVLSKLVFGGRALEEKGSSVIRLIMLALRTARFDDKVRIKQVLLERRSGMERSLVSSSMRYALGASLTPFSIPSAINERVRGLLFLRELRHLTDNFEARWTEINSRLEKLRAELLASGITHGQIVGTRPEELVAEWLSNFSSTNVKNVSPQLQLSAVAKRRGFVIPSQVNYNSQVRKLDDTAITGGTGFLAAKIIGEELFLERIRLQGGAYGGTSNFASYRRMWMFGSHRDPNLAKSYDVFDTAGEWLRSQKLDKLALERSVIGLIGGRDEPLSVESKASFVFSSELTGRDHAVYQKERDQIFATSAEQLERCGAAITAAPEIGCATFGNIDALKAFKQAGGLDTIEDALTGASIA